MILMTLRIVPPPEKQDEDEILQTLHSIVGPTEVQPGCISCRVYQEVKNVNAILLAEEWSSEQDLARHIRSEDFRKVLAVMDMSIKPPEVKWYLISETSGMEFVKALRESD